MTSSVAEASGALKRRAALSVLVVDDDSALIRTLADILEMNGYAANVAGSGSEGLRIAAETPPALAVVDLRLPDMDGLELAGRLQALSALTEVVVLTGNATIESAIAALRQHSVDYLLKPVQVERLLEVVSVATERWQRRTTEVALQESEERYRLLFDRNPQPAWVFDRETLRFLAVNEAAVSHYGYSREEFERMTVADIRPPEEQPRFMAAAAGEGPWPSQRWRHRRRDGTLLDVEIHTHDITFDGRPARFVLASDVTDRLRHERAIEDRNRQHAALAQFGERALAFEDLNELFRDAGRIVAEQLAVPVVTVAEYRPDASHAVLRHAHGIEAPVLGRRTAEVLGAQQLVEGVTVEIPGSTRAFGALGAHDRRPRSFSPDATHFLQALAQLLGTAVERSRSETALRQSQRLEAVGKLAGGVAHDFNNMLTAITGYGELLRTGLPPASPLVGDAEEILKAADRAASLTRQLLAFSRQQVLQPRLVSVNDAVRDMEGMLRRLIPEHIAVTTILEPQLRAIRADPSQLQQVLLNLCVNARDAMPAGGRLTITTKNARLADFTPDHGGPMARGDAPCVMLTVHDTGSGMDADTKARLFEPFFTTKAADQGTGLGLATVYGIVKQSGGDITVESEPGAGATFSVCFPAVEDEAPADEVAAPKAAAPVPADPPVEQHAGITVLLAEDEEPVRRLAHRILSRAGYHVLPASSGPEAARIAREHQGAIHLLVTDLVMPDMDGNELAVAVRALHPDIRVLFLSGYTEDMAMRSGGFAPGERFLQKPFSRDLLVQHVQEVLDARIA